MIDKECRIDVTNGSHIYFALLKGVVTVTIKDKEIEREVNWEWFRLWMYDGNDPVLRTPILRDKNYDVYLGFNDGS